MSITVKKLVPPEHTYTPTEQTQGHFENYLNIVGQVEVTCDIRVGTLKLTVEQLMKLSLGNTLPLDQKTHEPVTLLLNQQVIAKGELMCTTEHFAIKITEIAS